MARKFCCRTPDFVNSLFKVLGEKVDLALSDRCFDFSCPSCGRFRKKNLADAVTGRQCPHSGKGEDFLTGQLNFFTETAVTPEQKVEKLFPMWEINRHAEG